NTNQDWFHGDIWADDQLLIDLDAHFLRQAIMHPNIDDFAGVLRIRERRSRVKLHMAGNICHINDADTAKQISSLIEITAGRWLQEHGATGDLQSPLTQWKSNL